MQKVFNFKNGSSISITETNIYTAGDSKYASDLKSSKQSWHMITISNRNRQVKKDQILKAFYEIIDGCDFFPVGYKESKHSDSFLVRQCWDAIDRLFARKLYLDTRNLKDRLKLEIALNAAPYSVGQISPIIKLHETIGLQLKNLQSENGVRNILSLVNLNEHPNLEEIYVNLANQAVLKHVFDYIREPALSIFSSINGIDLRSNGLKNLECFALFEGVKIQLINLRDNDISSTSQLQFLKNFKFREIYLSGNPVCQRDDFVSFMKKNFPVIVKSDIESTCSKPVASSSHKNKRQSSTDSNVQGSGMYVDNIASLEAYSNSSDWHQIIVEHQGKYNKEEIAQEFFQFFSSQVNSENFYICYYKAGLNEDSFLVRNCFEHLKVLMKNDLKLNMLEKQEQLQIRLIMNYSRFRQGQVEPDSLILDVAVKKSFNLMGRCLNLENFNSKADLKDLYVNVSNPKVYSQILSSCGRKFLDQIVEVRLGHNYISNCKGLKSLNTMQNLKVLYLNDNQIKNVEDLECISHICLKELTLDGNPLCKNYDLATAYIQDVIKVFPNLSVLDGVAIESNSQVLGTKKNFVCSMDVYDLTEQFVQNYFHVYDSDNRGDLSDMYNENALVSISYFYKPRSNYERFDVYRYYDRNILKPSSGTANVIHNERNVAKLLQKLPKTEHDFYSFTIDTLISNDNMIVISVVGVFKDISDDSALEPDITMAFSRTFVLTLTGSNMGIFNGTKEYEITNDMLNLFNPTDNLIRNSFKFKSPETVLVCAATDNSDKIAFMSMFQQLTKLKKIWVTRCLDEGNWNFEDALKFFVTEVEKGGIPQQGFLEIET